MMIPPLRSILLDLFRAPTSACDVMSRGCSSDWEIRVHSLNYAATVVGDLARDMFTGG
jgi:hypothetical protein